MKIININVWNGGELLDNLIKFLKKEKPDILAMQEVHNEQQVNIERRYRTISELQNSLGLSQYAFSPQFVLVNNKIKSARGNAILTNFPVRQVKTIFFDVPYKEEVRQTNKQDYTLTPRAMQYAQININETTLNMYNVHGIWGMDGDDNSRRLKMSGTIINNVKDKKQVILCGDFNTNAHTKSIQNIGKVLHNVFDHERKTSFNMKRKPTNSGFAKAVVDNMFVSSDIKIISHSQPDVDISDHLPLVVEMEI